MADPLFPNPSEAEPASPPDWIIHSRQSAQAQAFDGLEGSPDDAARAMELGRAANADPQLVLGNLDEFEKQHKAALVSGLLNSNQFLRQYANSDPMVAKVSADDWGQLDAVSQAAQRLKGEDQSNLVRGRLQPLLKMLDEVKEPVRPSREEIQAKGNDDFNLLKNFKDQLGLSWEQVTSGMAAATDPNRPMVERALAVPSGIVGGAVQAAGSPVMPILQFIGGAIEKASGGRVSSEEIQAALGIAGVFTGGMHEGKVSIEQAHSVMQQMREVADVAKPFIESKTLPPVGLHPIIDDAHAEQAKLDMKGLDDLAKEAQKSTTLERAPDLFEDFIKQHTDAKIGISADAVRKLYGDKQIEAGDGILGDIKPSIAEQLILAEAHGGDVEVPLAAWLAKVEPEVAKELHDNIRVRPGGMTLEEAKGPEAIAAKPLDEEGEYRPYKNVPDQLMGFPREGQGKPFEESKYSYAQNLRVSFEDQPPFEDAIKGLNKEHALERARRNWPGAKIEAIEGPIEALRSAAGLSPEALPARTFQEGVAELRAKYKGVIPTDAEEHSLELPSGKSVPAQAFDATKALKEINKDQLTGVPRAIAEFFGDRLDKMAGDTPVITVDTDTMEMVNKEVKNPAGTPAFYWPPTHAIVIRSDIARGGHGHNYISSVLTEEVAHAATAREMEANPALKAKVRKLLDEAHEWLSDTDPEVRKQYDYQFSSEDEFIAGAFNPYLTDFHATLANIPISEALSKELGYSKVKTVWDVLREFIKDTIEKIIGTRPDESILDGVLRLGPEFEEMNKLLREPEDASVDIHEKSIPAQPFDRPAALGMNKERAERYRKLIEKQQEEDAAHQQELGLKAERERQTAEWKENYARVRGEVQEDLKSRPDIAADRYLRMGELYGEKGKKVKLDRNALSDEQARGLPPDYLAANGINPDDLGGLFGYSSGDALVAGLSRLEAERQMEGLTPQAHFTRLVDAEADRAMRKQYGDLEQNIIEEAKEHVLSPTQLDILHEEMLALGEKAGGPKAGAISKDEIKSWVKTEFDKQPLSAHNSSKYMAAAGRAGQAAEDALLVEKPSDAYKAKQQQVIAIHLAAMAKKLEKEQVSYEKLAKRFSKREVSGVPAEYLNWVHDIIGRTGTAVRRSIQDLQDAIGRETHSTLQSFVDEHNHDARIWEMDNDSPSDFQVMPVASFLYDPAYRKQIEDMTPPEFRAVANSVKTLIKNGQDEKKINVAGDKADLAETIGKMTDQLATLFAGKERQYAFGHKDEGVMHGIRTYLASLLQIESIFNRFDRGDPKGIFRKVIVGPIFEGSHELNTLETRYSKLYRELDFKAAELKKKVDNPLFGDPLRGGEKSPMTKGNLLAVLQNVGNASNLDKLARGYGIKDPNAIMQWLFANTKKEDWDRAQALGDIFKQAFDQSSTMYHSLSGVAPEKIDLQPIQTPFGNYEGWYHPVIYDPLRPGSSKKLMGPSPMEDGSYFRAATPSGYTKRRSGYAAPIQLSFDSIPNRLKSILNDIAMRPAVTEVAKVFYDRNFQMAMTKYYGKEIKDLMIPYLKDIAGQKTYKDAAQSTAMRYLEFARQNVTATLIGLNPSTVLKHGPTAAMLSIKEVGAVPFLRELKGLLTFNDELGERNWSFAMKGGTVDGSPWSGSEELQRRHRNWQETLTGAQADVFGENTLRNTVIKLGATPVAISDLLSAVPTWLAAYKDQIRNGEPHGDAVAFADTAVRRAHGSSAVAARPRIMRGGPLAQLATPFYTFFNEMFQRQYEMAWRAKDALGQFSEGEYKAGLAELPNLAKGLWAYVVFPALIEQAVSPLITGQESIGEKVLTYGARTIASGLPILRDMVEAYLGGRDPTVGLYSTGVKMLTDAVKDISKGEVSFNKQHAGKTIMHTATAFGAVTGLTNAQMGRTGEYVYNYATGKERPKDVGELLRGLWHGTSKEPRR